MNFSRQALLDSLRTNIMVVTFRKVNGDIRDLICTLQPEYWPVATESAAATTRSRVANDEVICVWDLADGAWKSFRVDSVINFKIVPDVPEENATPIENRVDPKPAVKYLVTAEGWQNALIVDGVVYTFMEAAQIIMSAISEDEKEWYAPENEMTLMCLETIVGLLRKPKTKEDWIAAVVAGNTEDDFFKWKTTSQESFYD